MSHDPYQMQPTQGVFTGLTNPFGSPYGVMQTSAFNPVAGGAQGFAGQQGIPAYGGISPQQLQLASLLASQAQASQMFGQSQFGNPWQNALSQSAWQNPLAQAGFQNPLAQGGLQNPLVVAALQNQLAAIAQQQNPYINPYQQQNPYANPYQQQGQIGSPYGQPYAQFNNPFAQPTLAPQTWVGQGQIGQHTGHQGQINPVLLQSVARAIQQTQGINPWGTF